MSDRFPWFPFYSLDWRTSLTVRAMTYEQRGRLMDRICEACAVGDLAFLERFSFVGTPKPAPTTKGRRWIPKAVRNAVLARDDGRCRRCASRQNLQFDHVVPRIKGGDDSVENLQLLCGACNREKGPRRGWREREG